MEKISKIKVIHGCKESTNAHGAVFYHDVELENGDRGSIGRKKENSLNVGQELTYTIKENDKYPGKFNITLIQKEKPKGGYAQEDPQVRFITMALSYSKDVYCAGIQANLPQERLCDLIAMADTMLGWMNSKYMEVKPKTQQPTENTQTEQTNTSDSISASQITLVKTLRGKTGLTEEEIRKYMKDQYDVGSTKELTKEQASLFIDHLQAISNLQKEQSGSKKEEFPF